MQRIITLNQPMSVLAGPIIEIVMRPPPLRVLRLMMEAWETWGFTEADAVRFIARLSGRTEKTIRRLSDDDFQQCRLALDLIYARASSRRRVIDAREAERTGRTKANA